MVNTDSVPLDSFDNDYGDDVENFENKFDAWKQNKIQVQWN